VSRILALEVATTPEGTTTTDGMLSCAYGGTDPSLGVFVSILVGPASMADRVESQVRSEAEVMTGATAEPVAGAEGGLAFGSHSKSAAAVVHGDNVYYAEIVSSGRSIQNKRDPLVRILTELTR
jgi:hypothetical protein